jgi:tetratricopeptide (TPR) repeat protein
LYQQAIAIDPSFARAYAGLGGTLSLLPMWTGAPVDSVSGPALVAIDRAIALDSTSAEAWTARGNMLTNVYRWSEAEGALRRAIQLDPQYGTAYWWLCWELGSVGRLTEADPLCRRATELDPLVAVHWFGYGLQLWATGKDSAAHAAWARTLELDPSFPLAHEESAKAFAVEGKSVLALAEVRQLPDSGVDVLLAFTLARLGRRSDAEAIVRKIEKGGLGNGTLLAQTGYIHIALGDLDRALDNLISAARTHQGLAPYTPEFDPIRSHPRYAELMRAMNLQDQPIAKWTGSKR